MRFDKVIIQNYRQYQNTEFNFPKKGPHDLHLVIGSNGIGKTNILNAITWCLYNEEPHLHIKSKALPIVNLSTLGTLAVGDTCKVRVEVWASNGDIKLSFIREVICRKVGNKRLPFELNNSFDVNVIEHGSDAKILTGDEAINWRDRTIPARIREFFFFDGEQLDSYFISDKGERIKPSIYEISQVQLLNSMADRLSKTIDDYRRQLSKLNPNLEALNQERDELEAQLNKVKEDLAICREQIIISKGIITRCNEFLRGQDNIEELEQKRDSLNRNISTLKDEKKLLNLDLRDFIREYSILLRLYPRMKEALQLIQDKEEAGQLPPALDPSLLKAILASGHCTICDSKIDQNGRKVIQDLLKKLEISSEASTLLLRMRDPIERLMRKALKYKEIRDRKLNDLKNMNSRIETAEKSLTELDHKLGTYGNKEDIKRKHEERKHHEKLRDDNLRSEGNLISREKELDEKLRRTEVNFDKELEKSKKHDTTRTAKELAEQTNRSANRIQEILMGEVRESIRSSTEDKFHSLVWKKNTFDKLLLDEDYSIGLTHKDGYECLGTCSAAERGLLALSFTLALHEVSGFLAPLVIDTPVSRVSDVNRGNFAKILGHVSKEKQLLLFFTPSEYSSEVSSVFDGICSTKLLITSEDERVTEVGGISYAESR